MEEFAHNEGGGHDTEQNGANNLLPPVQQQNRILFADVLVTRVVKKSNRDLVAALVSLSLVVG